ncbi:Tetratricopeptide repeat protein 12-like Protein [Tribolium castaneum]|uniref:Tetratricopeptide repeat protein 12-like Protein n=1 Tax=Tribolium castaneum TaxID=7070 RepID=D2A5Y0_TRICA|nr:PREDICTED: tetratricopeptide repeat protein 12 [Tribolium castaneum]EFA05011.2 Tetratricopeptide repeat protein 12-like Protein [Tribolium castaneum]|eukprot:XP_008194744.1 PREDICTED: tetratricopeptide repeat protein 12 [Tribolium castaneum]
MEQFDEEFSNFLYKVNQVNSIVEKLASSDETLQKIGDLEARQYLGEEDDTKYVKIDENELKIRTNRTLINRKALLREENPATMSQEAFMDEVSKDADRRYKQKLIRREKMETFKKQATLAFRRGEYAKALSLYTKAIEQIRDSCVLYTNRALTYINLKHYDKAIGDCETALRLNENSLKAHLLMAKAYFLQGDLANFEAAVKETKERNGDQMSVIEDYVKQLRDA